MSLFQAMEISGSGLTAQRFRLEVISGNIANAGSTRAGETGQPYRRQVVLFAARQEEGSFWRLLSTRLGYRAGAGRGVVVAGVAEDPSPFRLKYDPAHPDANADGYVELPNVDVVMEMVDLISASRAYEANVTALEAAKQMALRTLDIGR